MAAKEAAKKGGEKKAGKTRKLYRLYALSGNKAERKNKSCPKCGPGMFLGKHDNRLHCGNCKYTEFLGRR